MSTTTPLTDSINALTTYANEVTGGSDTTLSDAVATLITGYGGGDNVYELINSFAITEGAEELEFTDDVSSYNDFIITICADMTVYGNYELKSFMSATSRLLLQVNGSVIMNTGSVGTNQVVVYIQFSRDGGMAFFKAGNTFRVGWTDGTLNGALTPPISGAISSIKIVPETDDVTFTNANAYVRLYGR